MLASRMLTGASLHHEGGHGIGARIGGALHTAYKRALHACLDAPWIVVLVAVLFAGTAFALFGTIRQELTPTEDRAAVLLRISAPQGVSLDYTPQQMQKIEKLIQPMRESGEIRSTFGMPAKRLQQLERLHGDDAGAVERAHPQPAGDHGRDQPATKQVPERAQLPGAAQQPRHPRRRQRPAIRAGRQRPQGARRRGGKDRRPR